MLAKEKEKEDDGEEEEETKVTVVAETITEEVKTETSTSAVEPTVSKPTTVATVSTTQTLTTTAESNVEYPISKDGSCPYCSSKDVRYIILIKESNKEASLPPTLESLLKQGKAFKMAKGNVIIVDLVFYGVYDHLPDDVDVLSNFTHCFNCTYKNIFFFKK